MDPSPFTVALAQKDDTDSIMNLLRRTFFVDEPLNAAVGLSAPGDGTETCTELEEYCLHAVTNGISIKAVDREGNIVGVLVAEVCPLASDDHITQAQACRSPKFQKILYILARREEARLSERFPKDNTLMDIKLAATDPNWRRKGIMNVLMKELESMTKQRGIRLLRMDTSSAYSAKSAERQGFTCVYRAAYCDIQVDGRPLVVPDPPHVEDRVYVKELF